MEFTFMKQKKGKALYYTSDVIIKDDRQAAYWANYLTRFRGPNTVLASFSIQYRWDGPKSNWFGFRLSNFFDGANSSQICRRWLNYLLNNPPTNILHIQGPEMAPDINAPNSFDLLEHIRKALFD